MDSLERALADLADWVFFETICCRVLRAAGYKIDPRGGPSDGGRDAIEGAEVTFQFSLSDDPGTKLKKELSRYTTGHAPAPEEYVYVTNQSISAPTKDKAAAAYSEIGIKLRVLDRAWLSAEIGSGRHPDLRLQLLAPLLIAVPDILRVALQSPMRSAVLATIGQASSAELTDERLARVRAIMRTDKRDRAESLVLEILGGGGLTSSQEFEARTHLGNLRFDGGDIERAKVEWRMAIELHGADPCPAANLGTALLLCEHKDDEAALSSKLALNSIPVVPRFST